MSKVFKMIHHPPTKYHHANPLTHFLNLHTSHATAAAAAALALATDGLGHNHGHHLHQQTAAPGVVSQQLQQQHLHSSAPNPSAAHQSFQALNHHQQRPVEGPPDTLSRPGRRPRSSQSSRTDEECEQDESSNDKSFLEELGGQELKREAYDSTADMCQAEGGSESENNIDIDVDDPDPQGPPERRSPHGAGSEREPMDSAKGKDSHTERESSMTKMTPSASEQEDNEEEEIVIDGKGALKSSQASDRAVHRTCASPCNESTTAVLDTDSFVGKSFTIAAILGLRKKQDEAAAAAAAVANEYNEGVMNLSTGAGFQQQQRVAAAAVAAAAMGRLPLVMAAAAAGMEKRDRADSVDSVDTCGGPLGYGGQQPPGTGPLTALQNLHQLPALHGAVGGSFSGFHPTGGSVASGHPAVHQQPHLQGHHPHPHHHHQHHPLHHQVNPHFAAHHFHHHQGNQQQVGQHQQQPSQQQHHQHLSQHPTAHQQQLPAGHHMALGPHNHGQNHNREKFKELGKKTAMSSSAASLKSKRVRTIFTPEQLERLEAEFERQQYMVGPERLYLAHTLQLTEAQVKVWFQNRRIKWRKHHLEITQQRLALIRQRQIASGVPIPTGDAQTHHVQQQQQQQQLQQQNGMSGGRILNAMDSPELTICTDSMDARSISDGDD